MFRGLSRPIGALLLAEAAGFGVALHRLGFYHDDWTVIDLLRRSASFPERVKAVAATGLGVRTMAALVFPAWYGAWGMEPLGYHVAGAALDLAGAVVLLLLLRRWLGDARLALAAALLSLLHPSHPATHHWWVLEATQVPAQAAALGAALLWSLARERKDVRLLAAALGAYFVSLLTYESAALLPPMLAAFEAASAPETLRKRVLSAARAAAPFAAVLAAAWAWQALLIPRLTGAAHPKTIAPSLAWTWTVYASAFTSLTSQSYDLVARTAAPGWELLGDGQALLGLLVVGLLGAAVAGEPAPERGHAAGRAAALAAALFLAAYLPYALSGRYEPQVVGVMSRTNGAGGIAGALALAALACAAGRLLPRAGRAAAVGGLVALLAGAFISVDWYIARQWGEAWKRQSALLERVRARTAPLPAGATVLLQGEPPRFNGAPMFSDSWDFDAALRVASGRTDLKGDVVVDGMNSEKEGVVLRAGGVVQRVHPYGNLFIYDAPKDQVFHAAPSSDGR